jgi:hypothetical protein
MLKAGKGTSKKPPRVSPYQINLTIRVKYVVDTNNFQTVPGAGAQVYLTSDIADCDEFMQIADGNDANGNAVARFIVASIDPGTSWSVCVTGVHKIGSPLEYRLYNCTRQIAIPRGGKPYELDFIVAPNDLA